MQRYFICFALMFFATTIYAQTDNDHIEHIQFKTPVLEIQSPPVVFQDRFQLQFLKIDKPYWLSYMDVQYEDTNDYFTAKLYVQSIKRNIAGNNNFTKIMAGVGAGFVVGIAGGYIGYALEGCNGGGEFCGLAGLLIGGLIGYHLGTPYGVYRIGNGNNENGSYAASFVGGVIGHLTGIAAFTILPNTATGIFWFISAPIGATIGYNGSRKFESNDQLGTALINLNGRQIELAAPMIYFHRIQSTNRHVQMIDILQIDL